MVCYQDPDSDLNSHPHIYSPGDDWSSSHWRSSYVYYPRRSLLIIYKDTVWKP